MPTMEIVKKPLEKYLPAWLGENDNTIVISTRVRIARNLKGFRYLYLISEDESSYLLTLINRIISQIKSMPKRRKIIRIDKLADQKKKFLKERNLATEYLIHTNNTEIITNSNETISILVNEEDHLRIQVILPGLNIKKAFQSAYKIERDISHYVNFDFSPEFGYLTSCPTNTGTGLRISIMLHLPALTFFKKINKILKYITDYGFVIRGYSGEGSDGIGDLYQLSNQITLGLSEKEIAESVEFATKEIIKMEKNYRNEILINKDYKKIFYNKLFHTLENIKISSSMEVKEAMKLLSILRLAYVYNFINTPDLSTLNKLYLLVQPYHLMEYYNYPINKYNKNIESRLRSAIMRKFINVFERVEK